MSGHPGVSQIALPPRLAVLKLGDYIPRALDKTPSNVGSFGAALHKTVDAMGGLQLGLYFENYASRFPVADSIPARKTRPPARPTPAPRRITPISPITCNISAAAPLAGSLGLGAAGRGQLQPEYAAAGNPLT